MRRTRGRDQVGAEHVLHRPARPQPGQQIAGQALQARRHRRDLVAHDRLEALAHRRFEIGQLEHLDRRLQVAERSAAAFGQAEQQAVAQGLLLEVAGHVVEHQDEAAQRAVDLALARRVVHRSHLHAQQPAGRRAGDELRRRAGRAVAHALADALERVRDQRPVEDGVDRAAEADQLGAAGRRRACSTRPGTGPGRGCCRAGSRRRGCRPRRSGSARPSAPTAGCARPRCRGWPGRPAVRRPAAAARAGAAGH